MPATDNDLRAILIDRSSDLPPTAAPERLQGVQRRVRTIRRRRTAATGSLMAALLLAGAAVVPGIFGDPDRKAAPVPAHQQKVAGGLLPRFTEGHEAAAYTSFDTDETREKSFTVTLQTWKFRGEVNCDPQLPAKYMVSYEINGKSRVFGSCQKGGFPTSLSTSRVDREDLEEDYGIRLGEPVTVTLRVIATPPEYRDRPALVGEKADAAKHPTYTGSMGRYRIAAAVYTPIPREKYPFPPRPAKLLSLDDLDVLSYGGRLLHTIDSRREGANASSSVVLRLPRSGAVADVSAIAPGTVQLTVNGVRLPEFSSWTWTETGAALLLTPQDLAAYGLEVKPGDTLNVEVRSRHFDVPGWRVDIRESRGGNESVPAGDAVPCGPGVATLPCGKGLAEGARYAFWLATHCGVEGLYADGQQWVPEEGQDVGDGRAPAGFDDPVDRGTIEYVEKNERIEYESSGGRFITFRPGDLPEGGCK